MARQHSAVGPTGVGPGRDDAGVDPDQPIGVLLRDLKNDGLLLMRQEAELAKREAQRGLNTLQVVTAPVMAAAVLGLVAVVVLTVAVIALLALALPLWAACLITGGGLAIISAACLLVARAVFKSQLARRRAELASAMGKPVPSEPARVAGEIES